ncbi:unnamed protein product, partial [Mesorhabditis spiculigera]
MSVQPSQMNIEEGRKHPTRSATASAIGSMGPEAGAGILVGRCCGNCFNLLYRNFMPLLLPRRQGAPKESKIWRGLASYMPWNPGKPSVGLADLDVGLGEQSYPADTTTLFRNDTLLSGYLGSNASGPTGYRAPDK